MAPASNHLPRRRWLVCVLVLVLFNLAGCSGSREPTSRADLELAFKEEFGFVPPPTVIELRCKTVKVGDSWAKWLAFTYEEATWQKILSLGFDVAESRDFEKLPWPDDRLAKNPNAPTWWSQSPRASAQRLYYLDRLYKAGVTPNHSSYSYLWVDEKTHTVYWHRSIWQ